MNRPQASVGERTRTPTGIQHRGEVVLDCADCGTTLLKLIITRNNDDLAKLNADPVKTKVQAVCEICGGRSYVRDVEGCFCPGAAADDMAFDVLAQDDGDEITRFRAWSKR
jgi:hypothetical protein